MVDMSSQPVVIDVTGVGRTPTSPDHAELVVSARGRGKKAATAVKASAAVARKVLKSLDGSASADGIGHASVHERMQHDGDREVSLGWEANHSITITIANPKAAFDVMSALAEIEGVSISGPNFLLVSNNAAYDTARQQAVADGRAIAASYASAAGLFLGRLVSMSDRNGVVPMSTAQQTTRMRGLDPAEQTAVSTVHMVFEASGAA